MAASPNPAPVLDDPDVPKGRKAFVPLENNPEVMSALVHKLGLSPALSFHDVFSIEDPELLAFVPRPANALLLVFPVSKSYESFRVQEDSDKIEYEGKGAGEPVIWYKQTIRNACGLIGILHAVSNGSSRAFIERGSDLDKLVNDAISLGPIQRADLLYNSQALENAHQSAASQGQSSAPDAEDNVDLHYVCFVKDENNHLWEMDGRRKGPLDRGVLGEEEDVLFAPANDKTNSQAEQYTKGALERTDLDDTSPLTQFHSWFTHAQSNGVYQPETVCLSTASLPSGRVSSRMVYLKELDNTGFVIYSNFGTSKKAKDLEGNKWASLTFWWRELERQVRVEGQVERLSSEESQKYYDTRIRGSRLGAWASRQSQVLEGREELEGWVKEVEKKFEGEEKIPVPDFWGGLRIKPEMVEFWQGRESRLHDRFQYTKLEEGGWKIERLSP
ncbi:pyridoxamine 5'-phosphate oxidase [Diplocarpon rosae]|nr:pyridoxamine 5'-phosphate oxidase [Diplocarpon rosae]